MNEADDADVKLLRASSTVLTDFEKLLPKILRKQKRGTNDVRRRIRATDLDTVFALVILLLRTSNILSLTLNRLSHSKKIHRSSIPI